MLVTIDYETYYSAEYSLSRMSEVDYILSPLFQTIMCAIKLGDKPAGIYVGKEAVADMFEKISRDIGWDRVALLSHNMRFDGAIAAWHYRVTPKLYLCTLGMARALTHARAGGSSLDKVSNYLGLPPKGNAIVQARGKRLEDFGADIVAYMAYCLRDTENCYEIFRKLKPAFPNAEVLVSDATTRMFVQPQVKLDADRLLDHLAVVRQQRASVFEAAAGIDKSVFSSNQQFADLLRHNNVDVPMKISASTNEEIPALAKNDRAFKELCEDDTQPAYVQALLAARIGAKSTLEETRTKTLLSLALTKWGNKDIGWCPVPLKYWGAKTGRHSGDGGFNFLNFKRGSPIRGAIRAPDGMRIVHRDSSQIEARMAAWMAGCDDLLTAFAQGRDVYSEFATDIYGRPVTKADVGDRFVGKTSILGLGYGCGAFKFAHMLYIGNGGQSLKIELEEAERIVGLYRSKYPEIPALWNKAGMMLRQMIRDGGMKISNIPGVTHADRDSIWLPSNMPIQYPGLREEAVENPDGRKSLEMFYDGGPGRGRTKIYGAKTIENISQALARIVVTDIASRVARDTGYYPFLTTYDSLDYCVRAEDAAAMHTHLDAEFARPPAWAPPLPLASEGGWGRSLLEAEKGLNQ